MEKFSEMKYVRPDGEAYIRTIQKETKNFNEAADFEGAHQAFVAILNANSHFNTTRVMASIRSSQDTNDEFYRKEMEYIFEIEPQIDVEMKKFYESYLKSSYRTELEKEFDVSGISKSPSIFDYDKLSWFNGEYLKAMTPEEFTDVCMPYYKKVFGDREMPFEKFVEILQKRTTKLTDIPEMLGFFAELPEYDKELFVNKKSKTNLENAPVVLREAYERLKAMPVWDNTSIHDCLINMAVEKELKNGTVMWPVRIAAAGKTVTPGGAVEILDILGREESLRRLEIGLEKLGA